MPVQENVPILFLGSRKCLLQSGGGSAFPRTLSSTGLPALPSLHAARGKKGKPGLSCSGGAETGGCLTCPNIIRLWL